MTVRLPRLAWSMRAASVAVPLVLAGCGPARDQFAPVCPRPAFLAEAADLDRYRTGVATGGGHEITDLVLHGRIVAVTGSCKPGDKKDQLLVALTASVELTRGPAMQGAEADASVFVAVTEGDAILDKRVYPLRVAFPSNVDRMTLNSNEIDLILPVKPEKSGAAYTILVGFQLTPDELAANRQPPRR